MICINNNTILKIEQKFFRFSLDKNYNYASCIIDSSDKLPKLNINLSSIKAYINSIKDHQDNHNKILNEIVQIKFFYLALTSNTEMKKASTIRDKSIIFYLFHFLNYSLFYILLKPSFIIDNYTCETYLDFFGCYYSIINAVVLNLNTKNNKLIDAYFELINYKEEFKEIVYKYNNLLTTIINLIGYPLLREENKTEIKINTITMNLLKQFIQVFDIFFLVNKKYNIIDYKYFQNEYLSKNLDVKRELQIGFNNSKIRQGQSKSDENLEFTFLSYTWLFNTSTKYEIIKLFNKVKQIKKAYYINNDNMEDLNELLKRNPVFFGLLIRRDFIVEDAFDLITKFPNKIQFPLKIKFIGEEAEDEGGVKREFFTIVSRRIFDANYGMFIYNEKTRLFWFNINSFEELVKYELIGVILGLALYNQVILDINFPKAIYKKLLGIKPTLDDLNEYDPELYNNLNFLINTKDKNLKENLDTNFTVTINKFGETIIIPLKPNGENIMINYENKNEYVDLYLNWFFNDSIKDYYTSFEKGFYSIVDRKIVQILSPQELELIICGLQKLDYNELKKTVRYECYDKDSKTIKEFWEILMEFSEEEKKKFLFFVTGSNRAPINGLGSLPFIISRNANKMELPSAHTCFNHLILPDYKDKELMRTKIKTAINYYEGFGLK